MQSMIPSSPVATDCRAGCWLCSSICLWLLQWHMLPLVLITAGSLVCTLLLVPQLAGSLKECRSADESLSETRLNRRQAAHQRQSAQYFQSHCQRVLSSFATSIKADEQLLVGLQPLTPRHSQAVKARLEHKLLIAATIDLLELYVKATPAGAVL